VHAEQAALLRVGRRARDSEMLHVKTVDAALVPSGPPSCVECSKLILAAGIAGMWLFHADGWRRYDASDFHGVSLGTAALVEAFTTSHRVVLQSRATNSD
jgi:hypothetical protein